MYTIYREAIQKAIEAEVTGRVFVAIYHDTLTITVESCIEPFNMRMTNISKAIVTGTSAQTIADDFVKRYAVYVMKKFFKR